MYRLGELRDSTRKAIGWGLVLVGTLLLVIGVLWIHYTSLDPKIDGGLFDWVPRSVAGEPSVIWKGLAYLTVFAASQMMLAGALFIWVLNQPMTWARAAFAGFVAWIELVIIFGMVPSEWLNYATTDLDWSSQRVAVTIPPVLVLGNEVEISWAVVKDSVSGLYHIVMLAAAGVFAIQVQKMKEGRPASAQKPEPKSPYGRPLVRGDA